MELVIGVVGAESLPKFWSNFTDVSFVPIPSNSPQLDDRLSCLIFYYDLLSTELPSISIPVGVPYILMWVGVDLTEEQIAMYRRSSGNYIIKGNIDQHAVGIHSTAKQLAMKTSVLRRLQAQVTSETTVDRIAQELKVTPEDIENAIFNTPEFDLVEGKLTRVVRRFYKISTSNGVVATAELLRLSLGTSLEAFDLSSGTVMVRGENEASQISNLILTPVAPDEIAVMYPVLKERLRVARGGDVVRTVQEEFWHLKDDLLRELRLTVQSEPSTGPSAPLKDIELLDVDVVANNSDDKVFIIGTAHNPNDKEVDNLFLIAYEPKTVVWGPRTLAAQERVPFEAQLPRSETTTSARVVIVRKNAEKVLAIRPPSPQIAPVGPYIAPVPQYAALEETKQPEPENLPPQAEFDVQVITPFTENYEMFEGETRVLTAKVKNTGSKPWNGGFIAPKFPSGIYMPISPVQPGETVDLSINVGPYPPQLYKLEYQIWVPEQQYFGPIFYFLVKVNSRK